MRFRWSVFAGAALALSLGIGAIAPVAPLKLTLTQPDGTTFTAFPKGSGYADWMETEDGHSIVQKNGAWFYADRADDGSLVPSEHLVGSLGEAELADRRKHLRPPLNPDLEGWCPPRRPPHPEGEAPLLTTQYVLTLLVEFTPLTLFSYTDASFQALLYGTGGSVKGFFSENSYGNFVVTAPAETFGTANDGVIRVTLAYAHPNFGSTFGTARNTLVKDALTAADASINFAAYDTNPTDGWIDPWELSIQMIVAGYENSFGGATACTPRIWGHSGGLTGADVRTLDGVNLWSFCMVGEKHASNPPGCVAPNVHQTTVGIICHELGHNCLGLPDLYDTDGGSEGIGEWGLMGSGNWNQAGVNPGDTPAHMTAWNKALSGFVVPFVLSGYSPGVIVLPADQAASLFRIWVDRFKHGESFFLESRRLVGFDAGLPGAGLLITHADDRVLTGNQDETHKLVDVEEADAHADLDNEVNRGDTGDVYPGSSGKNVFNDGSNPNSRDYAGASTGVVVTSIASAGGGANSCNVTPSSISIGDNVGYDEGGVVGAGLGFSLTSVWTALRVTNTTAKNRLEGVDVYLGDTGVTGYTVDFYLYQSMSGTAPNTLLHQQLGFAGVTGVWNRFLLASPQSFPAASERVIVLKIQANNSVNIWARHDASAPVSLRSYIDDDGTGSFYQLTTQGDLNQRALIGPSGTVTPRVPYTVTPVKITTSTHGTNGTIVWNVANCPARNYHLVWGYGNGLSAWTVSATGTVCNMGTGGSYAWNSIPDPSGNPSRFLWFLVVGDDGAVEGSWGLTSAGAERGGTNPSNVCGISYKDVTAPCSIQ